MRFLSLNQITRFALSSRTLLQQILLSLRNSLNALALGILTLTCSCLNSKVRSFRLMLLLSQLRLSSLKLLRRLFDPKLSLFNILCRLIHASRHTFTECVSRCLRSLLDRLRNRFLDPRRNPLERGNHRQSSKTNRSHINAPNYLKLRMRQRLSRSRTPRSIAAFFNCFSRSRRASSRHVRK